MIQHGLFFFLKKKRASKSLIKKNSKDGYREFAPFLCRQIFGYLPLRTNAAHIFFIKNRARIDRDGIHVAALTEQRLGTFPLLPMDFDCHASRPRKNTHRLHNFFSTCKLHCFFFVWDTCMDITKWSFLRCRALKRVPFWNLSPAWKGQEASGL